MDNSQRGFVNYILAIILVLSVAFLSQEPYFRGFGKKITEKVSYEASSLLSKATGGAVAGLYSKIAYYTVKGEETVRNEISKQKDNLMQNIWQEIKNYFAEKFSNISGTNVK